ncbi:MAG TPA: hypothetical protein VFF42_02600 [Candidatus Eremiobacteraceae bacterium]|nr:hypothetical protein [Candidatus Eremiobacteraceae bacterium]
MRTKRDGPVRQMELLGERPGDQSGLIVSAVRVLASDAEAPG